MSHCFTFCLTFPLYALAVWFGCLVLFLGVLWRFWVFVFGLPPFCFASAFRLFCPFFSNALDDRQCFTARSAMRKQKKWSWPWWGGEKRKGRKKKGKGKGKKGGGGGRAASGDQGGIYVDGGFVTNDGVFHCLGCIGEHGVILL